MRDATKPAQFYEKLAANLNSAGFDTALEKLAPVDSADEAWQLSFSMRPRLHTTEGRYVQISFTMEHWTDSGYYAFVENPKLSIMYGTELGDMRPDKYLKELSSETEEKVSDLIETRFHMLTDSCSETTPGPVSKIIATAVRDMGFAPGQLNFSQHYI